MSRKTDVRRRQSLLDISIQQTGSVEGIFDIVEENDIPISEDMEIGDTIITNNLTVQSIADYFRINDIRPATSITMDEIYRILRMRQGIGYWFIEDDFVVSEPRDEPEVSVSQKEPESDSFVVNELQDDEPEVSELQEEPESDSFVINELQDDEPEVSGPQEELGSDDAVVKQSRRRGRPRRK